jgi:hypothetical protein
MGEKQMEAKFTKGQWAVAGQPYAARYIKVKAENGRTVARVPFNTEREVERDEITDCYDADLIAAAPDMYAALVNLVQRFDIYGDELPQAQREAMTAARSAISKAEGK